MITATRIILPDEDRTNSPEVLRKALLKSIESPAKRRFEQLKAEGLDSETAASMSGLDEYSPEYRASVILGESRDEGMLPHARNVAYDASRETRQALQSIGSSAGSAMGAAAGTVFVGAVVKHSAQFMVLGGATAGAVGAYTAFTVVKPVLGAAAGVIAAAATVISSSLVVLAIARKLAR